MVTQTSARERIGFRRCLIDWALFVVSGVSNRLVHVRCSHVSDKVWVAAPLTLNPSCWPLLVQHQGRNKADKPGTDQSWSFSHLSQLHRKWPETCQKRALCAAASLGHEYGVVVWYNIPTSSQLLYTCLVNNSWWILCEYLWMTARYSAHHVLYFSVILIQPLYKCWSDIRYTGPCSS